MKAVNGLNNVCNYFQNDSGLIASGCRLVTKVVTLPATVVSTTMETVFTNSIRYSWDEAVMNANHFYDQVNNRLLDFPHLYRWKLSPSPKSGGILGDFKK